MEEKKVNIVPAAGVGGRGGGGGGRVICTLSSLIPRLCERRETCPEYEDTH